MSFFFSLDPPMKVREKYTTFSKKNKNNNNKKNHGIKFP